MSSADGQLADFRLRFNFPYLIGVFLGVNAIRGAHLLVDGPDCALLKAQHVWGRHDQHSTLLDPTGDHRIVFSGSDGRRPSPLEEQLAALSALPSNELTLATSLPTTSYPRQEPSRSPDGAAPPTGIDELAAVAKPRLWVHVPGRSLQGDWLSGYAALLTALATELPLRSDRSEPDAVGVVGYLFDRNEADHTANVAELERLLAGLGLPLVSCWLAGENPDALCAIARASTIVSLPYGREAARVLCDRTGARLVELDLPMGLGGTSAWLRELAAALKRADAAETLIDRELAQVVPRLDAVVGRWLLGKRVFLCLDPFLAAGLAELLGELGVKIEGMVLPAAPEHAAALRCASWLENAPVHFQPREDELVRLVERARSDVSVATSELAWLRPGRHVELGFPSAHYHALADSPFLGFTGALHLVGRIVNELRRPAIG